MNRDEMISGLNSIITRHIEKFLEGEKFWKKRHDVAHKANLKLEEQNKTLTQEKQALLDVIAEFKSESQSLATLNETLSTESQNWQGQCAELKGQYSLVLKELDTSKQIAEHWKTESLRISVKKTEVDEEREKADQLAEHWFKECEALKKELAETKRELQTTQEICDRKHEALKTMEVSCSKAFAAAEERHEDFKKRSDGILATMGENLQKKQEQIEALTTWKEFAENTINELSEKLESLKHINSFQEHRIEVLARKANKLRKKEQND